MLQLSKPSVLAVFPATPVKIVAGGLRKINLSPWINRRRLLKTPGRPSAAHGWQVGFAHHCA